VLDRLVAGARFARRLPGFLAQPLEREAARTLVRSQLAERAERFLALLERAVLARPTSLYGRLFAHAGIGRDDVRALVARVGLEAALETLHTAGVHVTLEEVKGRRPVRRGSLEIAATQRDFDNPLVAATYEARSGGSRSAGTRVLIDLDLLGYEAAHQSLFAETFALDQCVAAQWRPVPPGVAGVNNALRSARIGQPLARWFSQSDPAHAGVADAMLLRLLVLAGRRDAAIPSPRYVPVGEAATVARWLADVRASGRRALLDSTASGLVRVCTAAAKAGLDVSGTMLRSGGEPFTPARAAAVQAVGAVALPRYSMAEAGVMGVGCAHPRAVDEVHLLSDKLAFVARERPVAADGRTVRALSITTLLAASPKLLINAEIDDYGELDEHRCGCPWEALGLTTHLYGIRSVEKLTSEGMSFLGGELIRLLEEVLPARFGGDATSYQLIERERDGLTVVEMRVDPAVGPLDEQAVLAAALGHLSTISAAHRMMAESWREAGTLHVVRAAPVATASAKILPLHVERPR